MRAPLARSPRLGRAAFAASLIAIGLYGLVTGHFAGIWQPVPKSWPGREVLAYVCATLALATGLGLFWRRTAAVSAGVLTLFLTAWALAIKAPPILAAPAVAAGWESAAETVLIACAALALFAVFAARPAALTVARVFYGLCLIAFGAAHLAYVKETAALVPAWLPAHVGLACLTGVAYIAAGAAILARLWAKLAASLAAVQIGLFTLLVWVPVVANGRADPDAWSEFVISWMLTVSAWVVAERCCLTTSSPADGA